MLIHKIEPEKVKQKELFTGYYMKGVSLLFLTILGTFVFEMFHCKTRRLLYNNKLIKHTIILCLIYFTISFSDTSKTHPTHLVQRTFILWAFFLLFTKTTPYFTGLVFIGIFTVYVFDTYIAYHKNNIKKSNKAKEYKRYAIMATAALTLIGFGHHVYTDCKTHKKFNIIRLLLETSQTEHCNW